ncbi:hypothetical protein BN938_2441 [Mucinivorans hirudinis]|uniref:Uncharacterized protein n=1 Tax=Mucinivorans hirudinis TaxID=1433126 RepID=A0A060RA54_9BACT|nr:hypothetical protein BN938_2441 [Mucinivorans hirudinis]
MLSRFSAKIGQPAAWGGDGLRAHNGQVLIPVGMPKMRL